MANLNDLKGSLKPKIKLILEKNIELEKESEEFKKKLVELWEGIFNEMSSHSKMSEHHEDNGNKYLSDIHSAKGIEVIIILKMLEQKFPEVFKSKEDREEMIK